MIADMEMAKEIIARRAARELHNGLLVNLGIGLPSLVAEYISKDVSLMFQSENGMVGMGPSPLPGNENPDITNAGGQCVTVVPGGSFFDSSLSFCLIRGGHVDVTILGALEVDQDGNISNWIIPGKKVPGMGGAMDLIVGAKKVIVTMLHTEKGKPKILEQCRLPLTAKAEVDMIITELGVFEFGENGLILTEIAENSSLDEIKAYTEAEFRISNKIKVI